MYLKRLVIHGFKSFADRTVLELEPGVTGIVGPNGCGKSNVADAIKWVLGEQSPKSLRASSMQDVLFEGADTRPPMSFAEVSLLFTDCEKELGTSFNEVEVSRRVEREGGSDYYINGKACRLKDIQQLFRDTGIGRVAYSFLQQGQIDKLLSSNPMDRRAVFEEAAGISGFKAKREETLRKLADVETNLSRLGDILTEVSSQMASLKRQAARAVRAQRLRRQHTALEQALIAYDLEDLNRQLLAKSQEVEPLTQALAVQQSQLSSQESDIKAQEDQLSSLITQQQDLSSQIFQERSVREEALSHARFLSLRADEARQRIVSLEELLASTRSDEASTRTQLQDCQSQLVQASTAAQQQAARLQAASSAHQDAQKTYEDTLAQELELRASSTQQEAQLQAGRARLSALELESHGLQAELGPLNAQKEVLGAELQRLQAELSTSQSHQQLSQENLTQLQAAHTQAQASQASLRAQAAAQQELFQAAQQAHVQLVAEQSLLQELNHRYEGFDQAAQALLQEGGYSALVEGLSVEPQATAALQALLGLELEAVVPATPVLPALTQLRSGERVALAHGAWPLEETPEIPGLQPAAQLIQGSTHLRFLQHRLSGCYVCSDDALFQSIVQGQADFSFVAVAHISGATIDGRGLFTAAHALPNSTQDAHAASYLSRSQRLHQLAELISSSQAHLQSTKAQLTHLDHSLAHSTHTLSQLTQDLSATTAQLSAFQAALERSQSALQRVQDQSRALDERTCASAERLEQLAIQRTQAQAYLQDLLSAKVLSDERAQSLTSQLTELRQTRDHCAAALTEARLSDAHARHAVQVAQEACKNANERLQGLLARADDTAAQIQRLQADAADFASQSSQKALQAQQLQVRLEELEALMSSLKAQLDTQETLCQAVRHQLHQLRSSVQQAQSQLMRAQLEYGELESRRNILTEELSRRWGDGVSAQALNWRASLHEADFFANADEQVLELAQVDTPEPHILAERFPTLHRSQLLADTHTLRHKLDSIGPVNESALEDYQSHEARYSQLRAQVDDLHAAKNELSTALMELEAQSSTLFAHTFQLIRANFGQTFEDLFGGGKADLVLTDEADILNSGIEIMARPPGTQLKALGLLSGGQKTMTAVALLFAIYQVKPSPFCVLDELDAPLDDANIGRFLTMLQRFTAFSQFVIITHNKRTMASCHVLYGVTMQERGVSKIVSMRLTQAQSFSQPSPQPAAAPRDDAQVDAAVQVAASYSLDALQAKVAQALKDEPAQEQPAASKE